MTGRLDPPAVLTGWHDDGTECRHGFLNAVQRGYEAPWCAGGHLLTRLDITPNPDAPQDPP